jgi:putative DNA primase/helicase
MIQETPQQAARRLAASVMAKQFQPQALHEYQDQHGKPLYWRIRLKHFSNQQKWIRPMHCNSQGQFVIGEPHFSDKKPLYRLPEIINTAPDAAVWIVEGEWCADALAKHHLTVTTSGGADSVTQVDWSGLAHHSIIIWPDNDTTGFRYAEQVTTQLLQLHCQIQWIDVSALNLPKKGDCVDWLQAHPEVTQAELLALPRILPKLTETTSALKKSFVSEDNDTTARFSVETEGVFYLAEENKIWVCSKLEVIALTRDQHSENWGRLLQFTDADGKLHRWAMPMQMLKGYGEELCGELLRLGLTIGSSARHRKWLLEYITTVKTECRACCVSRTGWYKNRFVLPEKIFGETGEPLVYQVETLVRDYQESGTLIQWQQQVAALCVGNSRLVLMVSTAFASMLLSLVGMESGGIHLVGESSIGKTTALRIAASIYGAPDYVSRWRATTNGLESLAVSRSDTLLILDEIAQLDPKEAGEAAYLLANGMGKARANKTGMATRPRGQWRLLFLSAGEINLAQHIERAGQTIKAGQAVRLIDLPADTGQFGLFEALHHCASPADLSKALLDATAQYYGVAATAFLEQITTPTVLTALPQQLKTACQKFIAKNLPAHAGGQIQRVCERFALIAAAGELATQYGITGFPVGEAYQSAVTCFETWLTYWGGVGNRESAWMLSEVRRFFELHGESRFSDWNNALSHTIHRAGFKKTEQGVTQFYVFTEVFRKDICTAFDYRTVLKVLLDAGWLKPDQHGNPYRLEYLPGLSRTRCYVFTERLWENNT